jgi:hypothetical protein
MERDAPRSAVEGTRQGEFLPVVTGVSATQQPPGATRRAVTVGEVQRLSVGSEDDRARVLPA